MAKIIKDSKDMLNFCLDYIKRVKGEMSNLAVGREEALKYYRGDPSIVKVVDKKSKATTTDLMDVVEWVKPALIELLFNNSVILEPGQEEDAEAVKNQELLTELQLKKKNNWFLILHDWLDEMLKLRLGIVKYQWHRKVQYLNRTYRGLTSEEVEAKVMEPNVEVLTMLDLGDGTFDLVLRFSIEDEYPLIEVVPVEQVGFPATTTREFKDAEFMYHEIPLVEWKLKKRYGDRFSMEQLEKAKQGKLEDLDSRLTERWGDLGGAEFAYDTKQNKYKIYECFFPHPDTGEPWFVVVAGDQIVKTKDGKSDMGEYNKYECPPFEGITPIKAAHRVAGFSMYDLVKNFQEIRTAILRQVLDNLYKANHRRYFGDAERLNTKDFEENNDTNALVRTEGDPRTVVMPEEKAPLPGELFMFWEQMATEKDYHTGVPRSWQGVNQRVLNKTFRGQAQQVNQAGQRIMLMARLIAEMGIAPLVTDIVNLNIKFLKKSVSMRYLNEWVDIHPDNIVGKFDVTVNVGLGTDTKSLVTAQMQQLLGLMMQVRGAGLGIVTEQNIYHALKELVKAIGYKDVTNYVTDPQLVNSIKMLVQMCMAFMQQTGMQSPELMQAIQQVMGLLGLAPQGEQPAGGGTMKGQNTPEQAVQPGAQISPTSPIATMDGGDYFG